MLVCLSYSLVVALVVLALARSSSVGIGWCWSLAVVLVVAFVAVHAGVGVGAAVVMAVALWWQRSRWCWWCRRVHSSSWCWGNVGASVVLIGIGASGGIRAGGVRTDGVVVWLTYCVGCVNNQILVIFVLTWSRVWSNTKKKQKPVPDR